MTPAFERVNTVHALGLAATVIGITVNYCINSMNIKVKREIKLSLCLINNHHAVKTYGGVEV
jgi:hypothetical protein